MPVLSPELIEAARAKQEQEQALGNWHAGIFEATGNPVFAWEAIAAVSEFGALPPSVRRYLQAVAGQIVALAASHREPKREEAPDPDKLTARLPEILGMRSRGRNSIKNATATWNDIECALDYRKARFGTIDKAFIVEVNLAAARGISPSEFRKRCRNGNRFLQARATTGLMGLLSLPTERAKHRS